MFDILRELPLEIPLDEYKDLLSIDTKIDREEEEEVVRWYEERILSLESSGYLLSAVDLCDSSPERSSSLDRLLHLEVLLNGSSTEMFTFVELKQFSSETLLRLILDSSKDLENVFLPSLKFFPSLIDDLTTIFIEKLREDQDITPTIAFIRTKKIFDDNQFDRLVRRLILNVNSIAQLNVAEEVLRLTEHKDDLEHLIE